MPGCSLEHMSVKGHKTVLSVFEKEKQEELDRIIICEPINEQGFRICKANKEGLDEKSLICEDPDEAGIRICERLDPKSSSNKILYLK